MNQIFLRRILFDVKKKNKNNTCNCKTISKLIRKVDLKTCFHIFMSFCCVNQIKYYFFKPNKASKTGMQGGHN